jgi:branched-chain amino acid transport system substrate-binding protein
MSGVFSDVNGPGSVTAAKMAIEDFDPAAHGMRVELLSADHLNKPDVGAALARKWYTQDGVTAILDVPNSAVALAVSDIAKSAQRVLLVSSAATSDLTGSACSPNTVQWTFDTWSLANGTGKEVTRSGGDSWFFVTADYAFGRALSRDTQAAVTSNGGKILGEVRAPFGTSDFSSFLLQAQASFANVIAFANSGTDVIGSMKQAAEYQIVQGGRQLVALLAFITDIDAIGLDAAQGLILTEAFYWNLNDGTRKWSERFAKANNGRMPTMDHAGVYASLLHYLKSVAAAKSTDAVSVMQTMKSLKTEDPLFGKGYVREDGRTIHDMYVFQVKKPSESSGRYDYYKLLRTIPGENAFRPLSEGGCSFVARMK